MNVSKRVFLGSSVVGISLLLLQLVTTPLIRPMVGFDEIAHIDYAVHLSEGETPMWGDQLRDETKLMAMCVGTGSLTPKGDCEAYANDLPNADRLTAGGFSYQAQQPPLGYLHYAATLRVTDTHLSATQELIALRASNIAPAVLAIVLISLSLAMVTASVSAAAAAVAFVIINPLTSGTLSYVTNDSAALLLGSLLLTFTVALLRRSDEILSKSRTALAIGLAGVLGLLVGLTKPTVLVVSLAVLLLGEYQGRKGYQPGRLLTLTGLIQILTGALAFIAYYLWVESRSTFSSSQVMSEVLGFTSVSDFPARTLVDSLVSPVSIFLHEDLVWGSARDLSVVYLAFSLTLGFLFASVAVGTIRAPESAIMAARAVTTAAIALAATWTTLMYLNGGYDWVLPTRYLIPLVPAVALTVAPVLVRHPRASRSVVALAAISALLFSAPWSHLQVLLAFAASSSV